MGLWIMNELKRRGLENMWSGIMCRSTNIHNVFLRKIGGEDKDGGKFYPHGENIYIWSFKHEIKTIKTNKLSYNQRDDKRVVLNC